VTRTRSTYPALAVVAIIAVMAWQGDLAATLNVFAIRTDSTVGVRWETNLPAGSILHLEVFQSEALDEALSHGLADQFPYIVRVTVVVGQTPSSLTESISGWPAGTGIATMTFKSTSEQPGSVRTVAGDRGEHLKGPQVQFDSNGNFLLVQTSKFDVP
jgi:hypothetical protein